MNMNELRAELVRQGMTARSLAARIGMPETTLSVKMRGGSEFKNSEIKAIVQALHLSMSQVNQIFFGELVS